MHVGKLVRKFSRYFCARVCLMRKFRQIAFSPREFDSIRQDLMLSKLLKIVVGESSISWLKLLVYAYTSCEITRYHFNVFTLVRGCTQGSILGPLLFTIYVDEILSVSRDCKSMGYVDDAKIFITFSPCDLSKAVSDLIRLK